ncbi:(2E,6E)-farnesyl diphosphate synthase [Aestuariirhabdus litorea]|uniref:(2E,6E)-farnesyl diphosphate synthase n=1 Tax=Aestuariirhabdus litorea TaxID=2528527 RepID=A0A3P3VMP4_9GAMM|nr:farnesyl diphosphate synthase [Aestuariirhabdus litorea]RRJ83607.1 (2E,6E)-farnesyl diphosphate synthase [Aestuariirhabdus litorea]RWW96828.1 (2E,6E)-farnesyl diphosphate synthase [Endozoicomonadaceae bacterium GTF-13]
MSIQRYLEISQQRVDRHLQQLLASAPVGAERLREAMAYSLFNGGKRVRPMLVFASCEALGGDPEQALPAAAAVELIHAYSLVHDDLPAMDDDDLRRGKPTCHIAYDEATAILAGDALQALAFEQLCQPVPTHNSGLQLQLVQLLARGAGLYGMVAGQAIDLAAVGKPLGLDQLEQMHNHKTGALICASVEMGARIGGASADQLQRLQRYARAVGLAFQVQDDILDVEADTETLGKTQGADQALNKPTYPALLGLEGAKHKAQTLLEEALDALVPFNDQASPLRELARYIVHRSH